MILRIVDNDWVYVDNIPLGIEPKIVEKFSVRHPRAKYIDVSQAWDGVYRKYDIKRQRIARPLLQEFMNLCVENDFSYEISDLRPPCNNEFEEVTNNYLNGIKLEQYQIDGINSTKDNEVGLIKAVTGSGKTELAAGIIKLHNCKTVVIAEQRIVIEQIKQRLNLRDLFDVGLFYGGEMPDGNQIVVGSIQSLNSPPLSYKLKNHQAYMKRLEHSKQFQDIVKKAELLIVDEADRCSGTHYKDLFKIFKGRRKYGLSATPFDFKKPVENLIVKERLGSIIYEVDRKTVENLGRVVPIRFYMFVVGEDGLSNDKTMFDVAEREQMIDNKDFHDRVNKIVSGFPNDNTMILVDTCNVEDLGLALEKTIPNSVFIYGKTANKKRKDAISAFEKGDIKCLIGGRILKRGLDVKGRGIHNLILCGGGQLWSDLDQKIGRCLRLNDRGYSRVFAFMFKNNYYLYKHAREQLKAVVDMGYKTTVIFNDCQVDGAELITSRFRKPKKK